MPTITDVAKRADVSAMTVSRVLNRSGYVSHASRVKVMQAVEELDYSPHAIGRSLVSSKTHTVGVALYQIDYITEVYFATIIGGMEEVMGRYDYNLVFTTTNNQPEEHKRNLFFVRKARERRIDGLVIIDQIVEAESILALKKLDVPFVLIDRVIEGTKVPCVATDYVRGMLEATEHLIRTGHQRIGFLTPPLTGYTASQMLKGYEMGLTRGGLPYKRELVREADGIGQVQGKASELLDLTQRPTALLASNDIMAIETLRLLKARRVRVPQDVALISFNGTVLATIVDPPLTSVTVPLRKMGERAMQMLLELINGGGDTEWQAVLEPELTIRDSCGCRDQMTL